MEPNQMNSVPKSNKNILVWAIAIIAIVAIVVIASNSKNSEKDTMMGAQQNAIENNRNMGQSNAQESAEVRAELESTDIDGTSDAL